MWVEGAVARGTAEYMDWHMLLVLSAVLPFDRWQVYRCGFVFLESISLPIPDNKIKKISLLHGFDVVIPPPP